MSELKYAIYPGEIRSRNDGDWHYVTAMQLMHLYGVDPRECIVVFPSSMYRHESERESLLRDVQRCGLIELYPRYDGNYTLSGQERACR